MEYEPQPSVYKILKHERKNTEVRENKEPVDTFTCTPMEAPRGCFFCSETKFVSWGVGGGVNKVVSKACPDTHTGAFAVFVISKAYSLGEGFAV